MNRAELDELDAVLREHVDLFDGILGYFVGKRTQSNHRLFPGGDLAAVARGPNRSNDIQPALKPPGAGGQPRALSGTIEA